MPDFEFGAMENPGAVFFRETLLLIDPERATLAERKRAAEVICHELAHMWYGDLVTMEWWDDLWLNEAFATWMAYRIVDEWRPEWCMWQSFMHQRAAALDLDALTHTHPIYTRVRTPDDANASFDVITYEKGAAVIRMLERFLGPEVFCAGVRRYVREHRESNTVAADLWRALSEVSGEDLEPVMRAWIEQEGHPLVSVRRVEHEGEAQIELRQERFRLRAAPASGKRGAGRKPRWPVPWVGRIGDGQSGHSHAVRHLLTGARTRIPAAGADLTFVYGNADEGCFVRVAHDPGDLVDLLEDLFSLSPLERMGLVDHQWALVRAGRAPVASFMDLAARLGEETDPDVLAAVRHPLALMARRIAPDTAPELEGRLRAWIEVYYGGQVDALGWQAAPDEDERARQRRAAVLDVVGTVGRASALLDEAGRRCDAYLVDRASLDTDLADGVVAMAAVIGDRARYDAFLDARRTARTPQEQRRFLLALADFSDPALVDRTLDLSLSDEVATQDVALLLIRLLENRAAREATWRFARRRWSRLQRRMGSLMAARFVAATPALGSRTHRREVASFFREHPVSGGARSLRQALERFDWYDEYRRRAAPELAAYLGGVPDA